MEKLVVYNQSSSGGAFVAAKLHAKCLSVGHEVIFLHPNVISFSDFGLISFVYHFELLFITKLNRLLRMLFYRKEFGGSFSYLHWKSIGLYLILKKLGVSIVNIHWQGVGIIGFRFSQKFRVIHTLHDEYILTGGCHYTLGCQQYSNCQACTQTRSLIGKMIVRLGRKRITDYVQNVDFHVLSKWLETKARSLYQSNRVFRIPNPVSEFTGRLPVKDLKFIVIVSSREPRKGVNWFNSIIREIDNLSILQIGPGTENFPFGLGPLDHESTLNYLARTRYLIFPSYFENLSNVIQEALALGTFVICRPTGGNVDLIKDGVNGYFFTSSTELLEILTKINQLDITDKRTHILLDNSIETVTRTWGLHV
jgi:glycosyltransferase involved in cell wall biosynthesis